MSQNALQAALQTLQNAGVDLSQLVNASPIGQDRLVRKEVSLGAIRELEPPQGHIGDTISPWMDVAADDVIFDYLTVQTDGLAPARAEDAEAELAQKDDTIAGQGRASVIDWSLKDHYDSSDVKNYQDLQRIAEAMRGGALPLLTNGLLQDWNSRVARDRVLRRRKLDNRHEQLVIDSMANGEVAYNDGRIKFLVPWGRPADQKAGNAANNIPKAGVVAGVWDMSDLDALDPIRFFNEINEFFKDRYGIRLKRVTGDPSIFNAFWLSQKFSQRAGLGAVYDGQGNAGAPDLLYAQTGWSPQAARAVVQASTGMEFREYESVYRTRAPGSNTVTLNRFLSKTRMFFEPDPASIAEIAATQLGFSKTLTSPHPEGNWTAGFYEWEKQTTDPWGQDVGNGCKFFPVFPHMEFTYAVDVILPS